MTGECTEDDAVELTALSRRQDNCRSRRFWSGGGVATVADEELAEDVERALEASHAFFEPAHAVAEICEAGTYVAAEVCEAGIYVAAEVCEAGIYAVVEARDARIHVVAEVRDARIHVAAEILDAGIHLTPEISVVGVHMVSEIRDFAAQPLDVLAREAVQVEHDADDDGR